MTDSERSYVTAEDVDRLWNSSNRVDTIDIVNGIVKREADKAFQRRQKNRRRKAEPDVAVNCTVCGLRKKPIGRDAPAAMANSLCNHECPGHHKDPYPGHLWSGETEPVPTGEPCCADCHRLYGSPGFPDLVIPNDTWKAISPTGDEGGLLCPSCICERLVARGFAPVCALYTEQVGGDAALCEALEPFGAYLTILEVHCHLTKLGPLDDKDTILHFMGSGASCRVTVKQLRDLLALSARPPETHQDSTVSRGERREQGDLNASTVLQYPPDGIPAQGDDDG